MTASRATPEQAAAVEAFATGGSVKIEAGAGTGKTTTLKMLAGASPVRRGLYVAYNKAIAEDAKRSFPATVDCRTAHSLAFRAVGSKYRDRVFDAPRITSQLAARVLGINQPLSLDECLLQPAQLASLAQETVSRYCSSTADIPEAVHVPPVTDIDTPAQQAALAQVLVPLARKAWDELQQPVGQLRFTHDCYLKLWHLSRPTLRCDYVLFDEAQDADPVIAAVIGAQHHAQRVYVGDSCQAIYGWRGAIDAMSTLQVDHTMYLTQSFRFGPAAPHGTTDRLSPIRAAIPALAAGFIAAELLCGPRAGPRSWARVRSGYRRRLLRRPGTRAPSAVRSIGVMHPDVRHTAISATAGSDHLGHVRSRLAQILVLPDPDGSPSNFGE